MKSHLRVVPLQKIKVGERFRKELGVDYQELVESIKEKGMLQPITVDSDYNLLAGGRRFKAAADLDFDSIDCLVRPIEDELDAREIELFENIHRKQLAWHEECDLIKHIDQLYKDKFGDEAKWKWGQRDLAEMVGKSQALVNRKLQLAEAMVHFPELKELPTEDEAVKTLKKLETTLVVAELRRQQEEEIKKGGLEPVEFAKSHFRVGDAFEGMREIVNAGQGKTISLIELDPPYGVNLDELKRRQDNNVQDDLDRYNEICKEDYPKFLQDACELSYDMAGDNCWLIFWHGPTWHTDVKVAMAKAGWLFDDIPCIWYKGTGQTNAPDVYLARTYEPFFVARKGKPIIKNKGRANVFSYQPVPASKKFHPTQKPVELLEDVLDTFAFPKSIICVPFLGSGVTLRAAYRKHMTGFGWDLDKENKDNFLISIGEDQEV